MNLRSPTTGGRPWLNLRDLAAMLLLAALVLLFFWRILTPRWEDRAVFPPGDFTDQFWMFRAYAARAFAEGRLPLWAENFNSGHPFLADVQSAIFYPVGLIYTLGIVARRGGEFTLFDLEVEAILHFILTSAFTYLFARRLLGSRVAALVSALAFTFSGYLTAYPPQQLAILETATWLPLILFFLDRGLAADSPSSLARLQSLNYIAAGVALGIAALAGHPQTFLFIVYAGVVYFVARGVWRVSLEGSKFEVRGSRFTQPVACFAVSLLIAAGLSAAQWIPTLEYQAVSTRAAMSWEEAAGGFPTLDPLQMILPGFASAFQSPLYLGVLPLWLALFALFVRRSREKIFWAGLALGSLLLAFGAYVFAYALFYLFVPGFALFRGQERLALLVSFALAILAGYGFRDLQSSFDAKRAWRVWALLPAGVTVSALMLCMLYVAAREQQTGRLFFLTDRAALMGLLFALASALVAWRIRSDARRWRQNLFGGLALAFIVFDLFSINQAAYNAQPKERFPVTSLVQTIREERGVFRVADEGSLPGHFGIAYRLEEIGGISPLRVARYEALLDTVPPEKLWAMLNVRYVVTKRPGVPNALVVAQEGETRLLRLNDTLPRAWLAGAPIVNPDDRAVLAAMAGDSFDPRATVYVAEPPPFPLTPRDAYTPVEFETRTPERLVLTVETPTNQLLVLSEVYYPGWRAFVDGIETPILRANVALRAVPLRAGAQRVEMVYDPWSVKVGIAVMLLTGLGVVGGLWRCCPRPRRML